MPAILRLSADDEAKIDWLMDRTRAGGGMAPVDLDRFWADQDQANADPFGRRIPQLPLGIAMSGECVFDELGVPEDYWRYDNDDRWRLELNRAYNDRAQQIVGRRLLGESPHDPALRYPPVKALHDIFEAKNIWHDRSWWLMQSAGCEDELKALLDRVERRLDDVRSFILPPGWESEKARLMAAGVSPPLYRWQRGPCTFATSIYGAESFLFLLLDNEPLAVRLRDLILRAMLDIARVLDEEAGFTQQTSRRGFGFADDNCALLTPAMYELFGWPILKGVFDVYSPGLADSRYQHSDSAMAHHLPALGRLNMTGLNLGPTVTVSEIRRHCPRAVIEGQLAPFTFCRDDKICMVRELLRDFGEARQARGLRFATAGSINNGSRLTGLRLIMSAIQHYCRYDE